MSTVGGIRYKRVSLRRVSKHSWTLGRTMDGLPKISILLLIIAGVHDATPSTMKEARKVGLLIPEKISTIIDIVHSHKNKPSSTQNTFQQTQVATQQQYQPAPAYQPQYPNYQYPPQNQGNYQGQYQNQYQNQYGSGYQPQSGGNNYPNYPNYPQTNPPPVYQGPVQQPMYGSSQGQSQGQFVQNQGNQFQSQNQQSTGQYQNQNQNQLTTGQYQNQNQNQNQMSTGQYQNQNQNQNQYQGSSNQQSGGQYVSQNQQTSQFTQGGSSGSQTEFTVSTGHQSGGPGPTCVCQAWSKPEKGLMNDAPPQNMEASSEAPSA